MADTTDVQRVVDHCRDEILRSFDENPKVAAINAYDAVTTLLIAVVDELRETRIRGKHGNA